MRGVQGSAENTAVVRLNPVRVWLGVEGPLWSKHAVRCCGDIRCGTVATVIQFYIPNTFRKSGKWVPPKERGKVVEFAPETKKTA